jgi:hypothetical protein
MRSTLMRLLACVADSTPSGLAERDASVGQDGSGRAYRKIARGAHWPHMS